MPDAKIVLDGDPLEALTHMARADVLVAARSQFSYAAIALSQGVVVYPSKWHAHRQSVPRFAEDRVSKCHVPASDSGNIDRDRLAAALRASREDIEGLLAVARESGSAHVVAVGDHPLLAGHNTPL